MSSNYPTTNQQDVSSIPPPPTSPAPNHASIPPLPSSPSPRPSKRIKSHLTFWKTQVISAYLTRLDLIEKEKQICLKTINNTTDILQFISTPIEIIQYLNQTLKIGPNLNHPHCYTFGLNYFYQTGTNTTTNEDDKHIRPKLVLPLEENEIDLIPSTIEEHRHRMASSPNIRTVETSHTGTIAIDYNGTVWEWGKTFSTTETKPIIVWDANDEEDEDDEDDDDERKMQVPPVLSFKKHAIMISCGKKHNCMIDNVGHLYTWGCGYYGRLGHGDEKHCVRPKWVNSLRARKREGTRKGEGESRDREWMMAMLNENEKISVVSAGAAHTMCVTNLGRVFGFGFNRTGQCGIKNRKKGEREKEELILKSKKGEGSWCYVCFGCCLLFLSLSSLFFFLI